MDEHSESHTNYHIAIKNSFPIGVLLDICHCFLDLADLFSTEFGVFGGCLINSTEPFEENIPFRTTDS